MNTFPSEIYSGIWPGGHCQGIAADLRNQCIYYSFTTMLIKTDLSGNLLGSVTGLLGHLGCIAFCEADGRLYGSLEYKHDSIGKGILTHIGSREELEDGFYVAIFDGSAIDRPNMDATQSGVMTAVFLEEVLADYKAQVPHQGHTLPHRHGCSGIDGITFGKIPGAPSDRLYLFVAYGIYGDTSRTDNDYQVLLCYEPEDFASFAKPLFQNNMHRSGPAAPLHKFFVPTGNTTYGVQNLEYDKDTGNFLLAVYPGKKPQYPNYSLFVIDGSVPPRSAPLSGVEPALEGQLLSLSGPGYHFPWGSTGLCSLGGGHYYVSHDGRGDHGFYTRIHLYNWDGVHPLIQEKTEDIPMKYQEVQKVSQEAYDFLSNFDAAKYADGRHELGNGVYVNIFRYETKSRKDAKYEAHRRYIDIQVVLEGEEIISVEHIDVMHNHTCLQAFNEEGDAELYASNVDGDDYVLRQGDFLILPPEAGHMPSIYIGSPAPVRKAVIKVPVK